MVLNSIPIHERSRFQTRPTQRNLGLPDGSFGEQLMKYRVAAKYSQRKLAFKIGANHSVISRWESRGSKEKREDEGEKIPGFSHFARLVYILGLNPAQTYHLLESIGQDQDSDFEAKH